MKKKLDSETKKLSAKLGKLREFDLTKTRAILVETSSLTKKCAGAEGEENLMVIS